MFLNFFKFWSNNITFFESALNCNYILNITIYDETYQCKIQKVTKDFVIVKLPNTVTIDDSWEKSKIKGILSLIRETQIKTHFFNAKIEKILLTENSIFLQNIQEILHKEKRKYIRYVITPENINLLIFYIIEDNKQEITSLSELPFYTYIIGNSLLNDIASPVTIANISSHGAKIVLDRTLINRFKTLNTTNNLVIFIDINQKSFFIWSQPKYITQDLSNIHIGLEFIKKADVNINNDQIIWKPVDKNTINYFLVTGGA